MTAARLLIVLMAVQSAAFNALLEQGRMAMAQQQFSAAAQLFERAVAEEPRSSEAHYLLGDACGELAERANIFRRFSLAVKTRQEFERAVALDPNNLDARYALVEYYTEAPAFMGGGEGKAFREAAEIQARDAAKGREAFAFIGAHRKSLEAAAATSSTAK